MMANQRSADLRAGQSRRSFLRSSAGVCFGAMISAGRLGLAGSRRQARGAEEQRAAGGGAGGDEPGRSEPLAGFPVLGQLKPVESSQVAASPLSVGFEVLDRRGFDPVKTYPHLKRLGVKWARCQTGWCRCETVRGQYDFRWLDEVVDALRGLGIQPWFCLSYGNRLYTAEADETAVGWVPLFDPQARAAWLRFTCAAAEHFRGRVRHWEIWNEPNITNFWKPKKPDPADYTELVRITAPAIRQRIADAVIIGGALSGVAEGYLRGCLEAGLGGHVDRISFHPYRPVPEAGYESEVAALRGLVARYNPKIRLWQGENGCPSVGGPASVGAISQLEWDETRQAKWLLRRILSDLRLELELTSYFHTVDLVGYRGKTNFKGLLRGTDYSPKPAYFAYQHLCALFDAATARCGELRLRALGAAPAALQQAAFVRGGGAMVAYWYPANLQKGWEPLPIDLELITAGQARLDKPALVDLLTGEVYALPPSEREGGRVVFRGLPLFDYPLLIADREALPLG